MSADVYLPADSHTRSVRWPTLLRASALKEHFFKRATQWSRLFKDVFRKVTTRVLRCSPDDRMSIAASEGELSLSGYDDSAALSPSGVVALSEPDPEMTAMPAMLCRAAENVGLMWNPPPCADSSSLHEWFLGGGCAGSQCPPSVPFFPEVHEQFTSLCKTPFTAPNKSWSSSTLTTLDGRAALGYTGIPSVERTVTMQLCPTAATALRGDPYLPLRTCLYSSGLTSSA